MGNSAPTSIKSLAALGKATRTKQRAPFLNQHSGEPHHRPASVSSKPSTSDPSAPGHRNPYYIPEATEQDPLAVPKAFGYNTEHLKAEQFQKNTPLGAENVDLNALDIESMQIKNSEVSDFVSQLHRSIEAKPAPGAIPSLEEQILVLQFMGADPREIAALQARLDEQNAKLLEEQQASSAEAQDIENTSTHKPQSFTSNFASPVSQRITIDTQEILAQSSMSGLIERERPSYARSQTFNFEDPFPESASAAHKSRLPGSGDLEDEPLFRHDPLQPLPSDRTSALARSQSSNPDIKRTIPGLINTEQMDRLIRTGHIPDNFPITNTLHIKYLRSALKVPVTTPIDASERKYRSRISSRPKSL